jgi:DinB superfamily
VLNHVNDGERLFTGRGLWFARGFTDPLPGFEQDIAVENAHANNTSWADLVDEFKNVRLSTISFFKTLPAEAWDRTGVASDNPVSVRAIAYIIAGHVAHHIGVLREKYL